MLPAGLLVGQVAMGTDRRLRVVLSADYERLEFLRVLRSHELQPITDAGALIAPPPTPPEPEAETGEGSQPAADPSAEGGTGDVTEGSPGVEAGDG
jgi:rod shape-determining protein MreC